MKIKASGNCVCSQSCNHRDSLKLITHVYSTDDLWCYKGLIDHLNIFRDGPSKATWTFQRVPNGSFQIFVQHCGVYECSGFSVGGVFQVSLYEMKPFSHYPRDWYIYLPHRVICCVNWQVKLWYIFFERQRRNVTSGGIFLLFYFSVFPNSPEIPSKKSLIVHLSPWIFCFLPKNAKRKVHGGPWWRFV